VSIFVTSVDIHSHYDRPVYFPKRLISEPALSPKCHNYLTFCPVILLLIHISTDKICLIAISDGHDVAGSIFLEVARLKKIVILSLALLLLLILIPGCFTFQTTPSATTPPVIGVFSSNPATINRGGTSTLLWSVTGANSVILDQGIGMVNAVGIKVISPATSTVYTLSATNSAGTVTRSAMTTVSSVVVPPTLLPASTSFSVTGITANTEPSNRTGCFNLFADITANGPGTASYMWESTDGGGYSYTWSITFPAAGTQRVILPVEMSALPSGPYRVHVLTPNDAVSNSTQYTTCAP
jgi:hypothetical protein